MDRTMRGGPGGGPLCRRHPLAHSEKVHIVGIGDDGLEGLTQRARNVLRQADVLVGEPHCLALVGDAGKERIAIGTDLDDAVRQIEALPERKVVVLADGDPLFYGVARYLCDKLGKDRFEVVPHVSSMQLAFARVKESWEEAYLTNLASHPLETVLEQIRTAEKVGLFTSEETPPNVGRPGAAGSAASTTSRPTSARTSARPTSG